MSKLAELRLELVEAHAALKVNQGACDIIEARIAAGVTGRNAEERKVNLVLALADSDAYGVALYDVRCTETTIETLEAGIENARDERRSWEWSIRLRLVEALEKRNLEGDKDGGFDTIADDKLYYRGYYSANGTPARRVPSDENMEIPF
jgi:hypothetical protein